MKVYKGLSKEALVRLWQEQKDRKKLDLLLHGPLFHDVFDPDFDAWRFYNNGTESGATAKENQDTNHTTPSLSANYQFQLRARVQEAGAGSSGGASTDDYALEYSKNAGAYAAVTASSSNVRIDASSSLTDGSATTNRATGITDGSGTFVAGEQEAANGVIEDHQLTADNFTEHVWGLEIVEADVVNADTLDFRITYNAGTPGMTNTVTPRVTITKPAGSWTQQGQRAYLDSAVGADSLTAAAAENANYTLDLSGGDAYLIIRTEMDDDGSSGSFDLSLDYDVNGGGYATLLISTTDVAYANGSEACTTADGASGLGNLLTTSTNTFLDASYENNDGQSNFSYTGGDVAETAHAVKFVAANLNDGDVIKFRTPQATVWNNIISITISKGVTHTGTGGQTAPTPTQSATGAQEFKATAAQTAPTPSQSANGHINPDGTVTQTVPTPSQSASGAETFAATAAQTAPTPSQAATGDHSQDMAGSAAQTAPTPSQAATGAETFAATGGQTAPTPSQSATGVLQPDATVAQTAPTPSQAAAGAEQFTATAGQTAPTPSQSATAAHSQGHTASAAQTAPTPTQAATGEETISAAAAQTAPTPSQTATGVLNPDAAVAQTAPTPSQSATGTHASANMSATAGQTAPTPLQAATASEIFAAVAAQLAPTPLQAATASEIFVGTVAQTAPTPSQSAGGILQPGCVGAQTAPTPTQTSVALFVGGTHRAESIMDAVVAAVTGLATTGANVYRARAWDVQVTELPALAVWQGADEALSEMVGDATISRLEVALDAVARETAAQVDTTLNLIREDVTVALMADYRLGLPYVEAIMERDAQEPDIAGEGDAPAARMRMNWDVTYHHSRADPAN